MRTLAFIGVATLLAGCSDHTEGRLTGYVEAETLYMAPQEAGVIEEILMTEGDRVNAGDILFRMRSDKVAYQVEQAAAAAKSAEKRVDDAGALAKSVTEAQANFNRMSADFARTQQLFKDGFVSKARLDSDRASLTAAQARLDAARAERDAAQDDYQSIEAQAGFARQRLDDLAVTAPQAGTIERIYRRPGEVAAAGDPVAALLPPDNVKLRFYAPERMLSAFAPGNEISFRCDGCAEGLKARVTYVATEPQFTPPVIYSIETRQKLVYLVEARPEEADTRLQPGQIVDVELGQ